MSQNTRVRVNRQNPWNRTQEENYQTDNHHVVEQPSVILATSIFSFLFSIDGNDKVEGTDDDNENAKDTDTEGNASP